MTDQTKIHPHTVADFYVNMLARGATKEGLQDAIGSLLVLHAASHHNDTPHRRAEVLVIAKMALAALNRVSVAAERLVQE